MTGADARRTQLGLCGWPTRRGDRAVPRQPTQRSLAAHAARWIVDTDAQVVTASPLDNGRWVEVGVWSDETDARIPPFDEVPLHVGAWWDDAETSGSASEPASSASSAWASEGTRGIPGERRVTSRKGYSVPRRVARPRCWTGATRWSTYPLLLKGVEDGPEGGFLFFTNYGSDKGRAMAANPAVALVFFWHALERQVRVEGRVEKVSRAESEAYFAKRPRGSQLGAVASPQSAPVASRAVLEARLAEAEARFAGAEVACPEDWGGYRVVPSRVEFWQGRESRLHDRIVYARSATGWSLSRLGP